MQAPLNVIHCLLDRLQKSDEFRKDVWAKNTITILVWSD